jgi:hypothetical protein
VIGAYEARRPNGALRFRYKGCAKDFTLTSGTLFASHKLTLRDYLAAIVIFCNEVKGKSMLALSRDLDIQYKSAFVLAHKLREAVASDMKGRTVGGGDKVAEVDGAYFGGYVKPANRLDVRKDRRKKANKSGKRQCVVVVRERGGRTITQVFRSESEALDFIRSRTAAGTTLHSDEAPSWDALNAKYEMFRINHKVAYSLDGACTNVAEGFFSRMRRAEIGYHHHISGLYLVRYAQEAAWREDHRRMTNGDQVKAVLGLALRHRPSVDFAGYSQRSAESWEDPQAI